MRPLEPSERRLLERFARAVSGPLGDQLRFDSGAATVAEEHEPRGGGKALVFDLPGYVRPEYRGQDTYPVDATVRDSDGGRIWLQLFRDENDRLFELLMNKEAEAPVIDPDWDTLEFF
jgi:hypothetical protein